MANRIKGITVEIGGDTTGLDKALKGVNSTIKSTQSQLRDVNRLLKLDPSNAKLLSQKQKLLQQEISETSEKLNALKEADKQVKVQLESGEFGQDKYDALQREIIETENKLKSLEEEAKKVPSALSVSMKEMGDKIKAVGDKTAEVGKSISTKVTAPIVAMGALSLAAFNEVDKGMDIIVQKTGASGKALEEMQESLKNIATSIPTDFETAGAAIGEVNTRFGLTGKKLEDLSTKFIKFAQLNNMDVSSEELGTSLKDNLGNVDKTFDETLDPIDKFQTSLNALKIVGADVGNSLMEVLQPMLEKFAKTMKSLNEKWNKLSPGMKDAIIKIALIAAAVGPLLIIIGKVISAVGTIISAIGGAIGVIKGIAVAVGALNVSLLPIIGIIAAIIAAVVAIIAIIKNWGAITEWFKNLWASVSSAVVSIWQSISDFFKSIWEGLVNIFTTVWETIKNVITVALMFIVELIQGYIELITLPFRFIWENCKEVIISVWNTIKDFVSTTINNISQVITDVMTSISNVISTVWNAIKSVVTTVLNAILSFITNIFNNIKNVASNIWNGIKTVISGVVDGIKSKVGSVFNAVSSTVSSVFNGIKNTATSVWNGIKSAITKPIDEAKNFVKGAIDKLKGFFNFSWSLPKIKLPHFSIKGSFSLMPPRVPYLSIDWYKEGGIMTKPTIFGMNGSSLMAGGEAGAEAVLPLRGFYSNLERMLSEKLNTSLMEEYLAVIAKNSVKEIILDSKVLAGELAPKMDEELGNLMGMSKRRVR